jgi:hypothetical protein
LRTKTSYLNLFTFFLLTFDFETQSGVSYWGRIWAMVKIFAPGKLEQKLKTLRRNRVLKYTALDLGVFLPQSGS